MQAPQRIKMRFELATAGPDLLNDVIPVFHRWIQSEATPATMIDVADYKHVPASPGVMLVGHADDLGIDNGRRSGEDAPGFYYVRKHGRLEETQSLRQRLREVWELALQTGRMLEKEDLGLTVDAGSVEIFLQDRLLYPPGADTLEEAEREVQAILGEVLDGADFSLRRTDADPREPVSWLAELQGDVTLEDLSAATAG